MSAVCAVERFCVAAPHVIHQTVDGEVILIHLSRGTYHSLRGSGALLFDLLVGGASVEDLAAALLAATDGDAATIDAGVKRFVEALWRDGLVARMSGPGSLAAPPVRKRVAYEEPRLETFTDLQDLLTADPIHDVGPLGWPNVNPPDGKPRP